MGSMGYSRALRATLHDGPSSGMLEYGRVCEAYGGHLVSADTFYRELFPPDTIEHYHRGSPEPPGHRGNPLVLIQRGAWMWADNRPDWAYGIRVEDPLGEYHTRHTKRILFNDYQWLHDWEGLPDCQHVWMSGLTYIGKSRDLAHAVSMHAMVFDIDCVDAAGLNRLLYGAGSSIGLYPMPTHVVISGNGVHLYYQFAEPVPLYHGPYGRRVKSQLNRLKSELTRVLWNPYTIDDDTVGRSPQYQGVNQAFRLVGSYTKALGPFRDRYRVIAYQLPQEPYDGVSAFYRYVDIPEEDHYRERSALGLEYWRERNPDWYERRIVQGDRSVRYWDMNRRLYDWWLRRVRSEAQFGHRYNCLFCTVVYAVKCNIPRDEAEADMLELLPVLTARKPDDPITPGDVWEALDAYDPSLNTYPVRSIEHLSGIDLHSDRPRRNGRRQADHLRGARALQAIYAPNWRDGNGRPDKSAAVREWRAAHPDGTKAACRADTGLSWDTIRKWWNKGGTTV